MTRGRRRGGLALLVLATIGAGCASQRQYKVDFSEAPRDYLPNDYPGVYQRWTRHDYATVQTVDKALEVWGTFKSWDFREAFLEKYASIYSLPDARRSELRQAQREEYHTAYEFHLIAQSANWDWNDLEKNKTPWVLTLVDALGHELPSEKVEIAKYPDAFEREFFPARGPFTKSYRIRFIIPAPGADFVGAKSGSLTLRIASPIGRIDLMWKS